MLRILPREKKAFTLIELLVVIAIIGCLIAYSYRQYKQHVKQEDGYNVPTILNSTRSVSIRKQVSSSESNAMKHIPYCLIIIAAGCFMFTSCQANHSDNVNNTRNVTDMKGRKVSVPQTVNKIFVDWTQGATILMTLGASDKLVSVSAGFDTDDMSWARIICSDIANVPRNQAAFSNMEVILSYKPDVVITSEQGDFFRVTDYERVGIPTVYVSFHDYDSFKESMIVVGNVLGDEKYIEKATKFNNFLDSNISMVTERLAGVSDADKKSVYYMDDSRTNFALYTVGRGEIQETWTEMSGGKFATKNLLGSKIEISKEKLLKIDPDIILVGSKNQHATMKMLMNDSTLSNLQAVKKNQVYRIPQGIFSWCKTGPESSMQMVWTAKLLYPDLFTDIDIAKMAKSLYLDFFGTDVSDENIGKILAGKLTPTGE